jgi:hypothetical protein
VEAKFSYTSSISKRCGNGAVAPAVVVSLARISLPYYEHQHTSPAILKYPKVNASAAAANADLQRPDLFSIGRLRAGAHKCVPGRPKVMANQF